MWIDVLAGAATGECSVTHRCLAGVERSSWCRQEPTSVRPLSWTATPSEDGADKAASTAPRSLIALMRELETRSRPLDQQHVAGRAVGRCAGQPATLSTAWCRPTSSRRTSSVPSGRTGRRVQPPGPDETPAGPALRPVRQPGQQAGDPRTGRRPRRRTDGPIASMLSLPHTPQAAW